jgi:hypothetical protein
MALTMLTLPIDCLYSIFFQCEYEDIVKIGKTCKYLKNKILDNENFYKLYCIEKKYQGIDNYQSTVILHSLGKTTITKAFEYIDYNLQDDPKLAKKLVSLLPYIQKQLTKKQLNKIVSEKDIVCSIPNQITFEQYKWIDIKIKKDTPVGIRMKHILNIIHSYNKISNQTLSDIIEYDDKYCCCIKTMDY